MAPTFVVSLSKCEHEGAKKIVATFKPNQTIRDIFEEIHPPWDMIAYRVECIGRMRSGSGVGGESADGEGGLLIDWASPLEDLKDLGITSLAFRCKPNKEQLSSSSKQGTSQLNAFDVMMTRSVRQRRLPDRDTQFENVWR